MGVSSRPKAPAWFAATKVFESPSRRKAIFQLADTLLPFLALGVAAAWLEKAGVAWYFLWPLAIAGRQRALGLDSRDHG